MNDPNYGRKLHLAGGSFLNQRPMLTREDILIRSEKIARIPCGFGLDQLLIIVAVCVMNSITDLLLRKKVDIGTPGRKTAHIGPGGTRPGDIGLVVRGIFPGSGDIQYQFRVAVAYRGMVLWQFIQGAIDRE